MDEKVGQVFSIAEDNIPVLGCTISREVYGRDDRITYFSLAKGTDISAEIHPSPKLILVAAGSLAVYGPGREPRLLESGDAILTAADEAVGMRSATGAVYTEVALGKGGTMNEVIKAGEVFRLAELVPYQAGRIVNMDVLANDRMKFVVMAFAEGTGLSEHAAPGEALIFALDGEGIIGYEGQEHVIKAGENFHFAKGGRHFVKAAKPFKMALLLTLE